MRSLIVALVSSAALFALLALTTRPAYAVLPALVVFGAAYWFLARKHSKLIEAKVQQSTAELQSQRMDAAIATVRSAYVHAPWVFLMKAQLDGQLGSLLYLKKEYDEAAPLLESAWNKHWVAKGMLASHWWRKHKTEQAFEVVNEAIGGSKKEALLYALKAWMQVKLKDRDSARATLTIGTQEADAKPALAENLQRLQNGQDLRMHLFGDAWYQFMLEKPSQKALMRRAESAGGGGGKKALYKG